MDEEIFEIYKRNLPFITREKEIVLQILGNKHNIILEKRNKSNKLTGISVINGNTLLLLCVDAGYRNQGIGTELLEKSEQIVKNNGYKKIVAGNGYDYIMPGVPTSRRYFDAENEELYQELDENASIFFQKRGYIHSWNCNCFDMKLLLKNFTSECFKVGNSIDGVTYCWAELKDIEKVCACTDDAYKEFTWYYQNKGLYQEGSTSRVLVAVMNGEIIGTLIITAGDECKKSGSLACITVKRAYQGRHIGVNLIYFANKYLKEKGVEEAYIGYTYTGLDHMYGYAGYKICIYYMMAEKEL